MTDQVTIDSLVAELSAKARQLAQDARSLSDDHFVSQAIMKRVLVDFTVGLCDAFPHFKEEIERQVSNPYGGRSELQMLVSGHIASVSSLRRVKTR